MRGSQPVSFLIFWRSAGQERDIRLADFCWVDPDFDLDGGEGQENVEDFLEGSRPARADVVDFAAAALFHQQDRRRGRRPGRRNSPGAVSRFPTVMTAEDADLLFDQRDLAGPVRADEIRRLSGTRVRKRPGDDDVQFFAKRRRIRSGISPPTLVNA